MSTSAYANKSIAHENSTAESPNRDISNKKRKTTDSSKEPSDDCQSPQPGPSTSTCTYFFYAFLCKLV